MTTTSQPRPLDTLRVDLVGSFLRPESLKAPFGQASAARSTTRACAKPRTPRSGTSSPPRKRTASRWPATASSGAATSTRASPSSPAWSRGTRSCSTPTRASWIRTNPSARSGTSFAPPSRARCAWCQRPARGVRLRRRPHDAPRERDADQRRPDLQRYDDAKSPFDLSRASPTFCATSCGSNAR